MPNAWFDNDYFDQQKVIQMNGMNYNLAWLREQGATTWTTTLFNDYLEVYRDPDGNKVTAFENFVACNTKDYAPQIQLVDVNVSCNPLFNVNYYAQSVADWANGDGKYSAGGITSGTWNAENMISHVFNDLRMSMWEHYLSVGMKLQLNPSANFDTGKYLEDRVKIMNEAAGGTSYTIDNVISMLQANNSNPIMDWYDYGQSHGITISPVPGSGGGTVTPPSGGGSGSGSGGSSGGSGGGSSSGGGSGNNPSTPVVPAPETQEVDISGSKAGTYTGKAGTDTLFKAPNGINEGDVIDGGANSNNTLDITLQQSFTGFTGDGGITNVQQVSLANASSANEALSFNAAKASGVEEWNIKDGPVNLENLSDAGIVVNLENIKSPADVNLGFAETAVAGDNSSLTVGLNNAGYYANTRSSAGDLAITANGIEILTLETAEDTSNNVSLSGIADAKEINVNGSGPIYISSIGAKVESVNASSSSGEFSIRVDDSSTALKQIKGGSGYNFIIADTLANDLDIDISKSSDPSPDLHNWVEAHVKTANIIGSSHSDVINVAVREEAVITGNGGEDYFTVNASNTTQENGSQADMIDVVINGKNGGDSEQYAIGTNYVDHAMKVTINGYDDSDYITIHSNWDSGDSDWCAFVALDEAAGSENMEKFFGKTQISDLTTIQYYTGKTIGYYDSAARCAYAFAANGKNDTVVGVQLNDVSFEIAEQALNRANPGGDTELASVELVKGKLDYTAATYPNGVPMGTVFIGVAGLGDESTLVEGVQISGSPQAGSALIVNAHGDFDGLGADGFTKDVGAMVFNNLTDKALNFNAENMENIGQISFNGGSVNFQNLELADDGVLVLNMQGDQQPGDAFNFQLVGDKAETNSGHMILNLLPPLDTTASNNPLAISANGVSYLNIQAGSENTSYIDINGIGDLKDIEFEAFDDQCKMDVVSDAFHFSLADGVGDFTISKGATFDLDSLYSEHDSIKVLNVDAQAQIGNGEANPFVIHTANHPVEANITAADNAYITAQCEAASKVNAELQGKDNYITLDADESSLSAVISQSATLKGSGGTQEFIVTGADENAAGMITANIIGETANEIETFSVNTANIVTQMRITIDGFDGFDDTDKLLVATGTDTYGDFASLDAEAASAQLLNFFGIDTTGLQAINGDNGLHGYYDTGELIAYGFAPNSAGEIKAGVQLNGVTLDLASQAFGAANPDEGTGIAGA